MAAAAPASPTSSSSPTQAEADDAVAETDGVKLVVDPISLDLVRGLGGRLRRGSRRRRVQGHQSQRRLGLRLRIELLRLARRSP